MKKLKIAVSLGVRFLDKYEANIDAKNRIEALIESLGRDIGDIVDISIDVIGNPIEMYHASATAILDLTRKDEIISNTVSVGHTIDGFRGTEEKAELAAITDAITRLRASYPGVKNVSVNTTERDGEFYASASGSIEYVKVKVDINTYMFDLEKPAIKDALKRLETTYPGVKPVGYGVKNLGFDSNTNRYGAYAYGYATVIQ